MHGRTKHIKTNAERFRDIKMASCKMVVKFYCIISMKSSFLAVISIAVGIINNVSASQGLDAITFDKYQNNCLHTDYLDCYKVGYCDVEEGNNLYPYRMLHSND